jgi:serine/threonine-protein kinase
MSRANAPANDRRADDSARLEDIVERFEEALRRGDGPDPDQYLPAEDDLRRAVLVELVHAELEHRLKAGEAARVEEYLRRYPDLAQDSSAVVELILAEREQRSLREGPVPIAEYLERFEHYSEALRLQWDVQPVKGPPGAAPAISGTRTDAAPTPPPEAGPSWPTLPGYEILGELGRGAMGVVYRARHLALKRTVALKMILAGAHAGPDQLARFRTEAETVARVQHAGIVNIFDIGEHQGLPYLALEYVEGGSLAQRLQGSPQPARQAAEMMARLAEAVHHAHQRGVLHRDLKPANVLLSADGTPKITDFGLAKQLDAAAGQTASGAILGTPSYMAPEQAGGKGRQIGPAADVWGLGAILYELLTGRPPFRAETPLDTLLQVMSDQVVPPTHLRPDCPRDLEAVCLKCLQKQPQQRYASAAALEEDLLSFLAGKPVQAPQRPDRGSKRRGPRRRLVVRVVAISALSLAAVALVAVLVPPRRENVLQGPSPQQVRMPAGEVGRNPPPEAAAAFEVVRKQGELAARSQDVLRNQCFSCHGENPRVRGDLRILDHALLLDKKRKIVVPGSPDDSELIQQVESGAMPPGRRLKVSPADRTVLRDWVAAGAPAFPGGAPVRSVAPPRDSAETAARVKEVLRTHCLECHGGSKPTAGVKILDRDLLVRKEKVIPRRPEESLLFQVITAKDDSVMPPPGQPRLAAEEVEAIRQWITEGAAALPPDESAPVEKDKDPTLKAVVGVDYVLKKILEDVNSLPVGDRQFVRYFSINHLLTGGATRPELDLQRDALAKALNHLSWEPKPARVRVVDRPAGTVFALDLREVGWNRKPFTRVEDGKVRPSDLNLFDLVLLEYPYGTLYTGSATFDRLAAVYLLPAGLARPVPYVRADWFVSVATQPPLYEDLLQLPFNLNELETRLEVNSADDVANREARRAGITVSGVSHNNRVVERHRTQNGAYWKSFDYRSSKGRDNIFRNPLDLHPAGGEMIFNLPNGLQGYFVTDSTGARLDAEPTEIVTDKFAADQTVRNGLSCMRCHDAGMKAFLDDVRPSLERLRGDPGFKRAKVLDLYPPQAELDATLREDVGRFAAALKGALGRPQTREPLAPVSKRFLDGPIQLSTAAAELGLPDRAGLKDVFQVPQFAGLGLLPLASEGSVRRDMWEDDYDQVVRQLGLGVPVVALDGLTRRDFGSNPPQVELKTNRPGNLFQAGDELVITVTNRGQKNVHIELIRTSVRRKKKILATEVVRAGQTYSYPPLTIRPPVGKEQITLFAAEDEFPPGEVFQGTDVTDRVVHEFYKPRLNRGRLEVSPDPARLFKQTIEIETR